MCILPTIMPVIFSNYSIQQHPHHYITVTIVIYHLNHTAITQSPPWYTTVSPPLYDSSQSPSWYITVSTPLYHSHHRSIYTTVSSLLYHSPQSPPWHTTISHTVIPQSTVTIMVYHGINTVISQYPPCHTTYYRAAIFDCLSLQVPRQWTPSLMAAPVA